MESNAEPKLRSHNPKKKGKSEKLPEFKRNIRDKYGKKMDKKGSTPMAGIAILALENLANILTE